MESTKLTSPAVSEERKAVIGRILANHAKLYHAGLVSKRLTAEGFFFTDEGILRKIEERQLDQLSKHKLDE